MHSQLKTLLFYLCLALPMLAQSEVGSATINGTVTDPSGATVSGAKITATNAATGLVRTAESNETGLYSLVRLPVGRYEITYDATGFATARRNDVELRIGATVTLDVPLAVTGAAESVTVSSETPIVETTRSQTSSVVNEKAVRDLPINGRNFLDFTLLTPGVNRDPRGGDLSFGGQRGTANSVLVDGADTNNVFFGQSQGRAGFRSYTFGQDSVQEFQVNTNTFSAEIGRAGGGVVNVITKSGTNDIHGTAFWFFRDRIFNANTAINKLRNIPRQPYHFNQYGGNLGGPVIKNKVFLFFNYDGQRNTQPNPVFFPIAVPSDAASQQGAALLSPYLTPYTSGLNNDVYLLKGDWNISTNRTLSVRYNATRFTGSNFENRGNQSAAEHTGDSKITVDGVTGVYTDVLTPNTVFDFRINYVRDNEPGLANSAAPEAIIRQGGSTLLFIGRNNFSPRYTNARTIQGISTLSYVRGRHSYKFGADLNTVDVGNFFPGNFSGAFTFNSLADFASNRPALFTQAFAGAGSGPLTKPNANELALFVQDSWRVSDKLTLNYGFRYDLFRYDENNVQNPNAQLLAAGLDTSRINRDNNNIAPRFGLAYKPFQSDRVVFRGGYGIYYGRTTSILTGTSHSQNGIQVQTYTLNASLGQTLPSYPNVLAAPPTLNRTPDIYVFAPDYVQPLTHQWSTNLEFQLGRDYAVTFGYLGVRGEHLTRTRDINLQPGVARTAVFDDGRAPATYYVHLAPRPNPNFGRISVFDSGGDSIYHGGFVQVTKRFSQHFQALASYTFSKVIDTLPDATSVVVGSDDAKVAQDTLNPNLDRAVGDANVKHRFVLSGVWDINYANSLQNRVARALLRDYQLSTVTTLESGRYYSARVNNDLNGDANNRTDRVPGVGRNTIEGPGFASVDLRVSRDIPVFRERVRLRLMFEGFNITNRSNFTTFNQTQYNIGSVFTRNAAFATPTATADPRILQVAARIIF